jgi:arylsulfatase A-like enzyme
MAPGTARAAGESRPNLIVVLADDLGYGNPGCYGGKQIDTPNMDRLASQGVRFTQAYAGSTVCAPSRCCLETGLHTGHARTRGNMYPNLPLLPGTVSLGNVLKAAGYRTGLVGKWSLGQVGSTGYPLDQGYDDFLGYFSQTHAHNYYPEHLLDGREARLLRGNMAKSRRDDYAPDLFAERALEFLGSEDDRPFFLQFTTTIPHANNEMGRDTGDGMEIPSYGKYGSRDWPNQEKGFAAMVSRLDTDLGRMLDKLKETGKDEDTLVLFTSDNGPHREGGHDPEFFNDNGPLRGVKRDLYEGGIRVPTMVRWPGGVKPGRTSDHQWAFWDVLPTFAELAGVAVPGGLDGLSIVPELTGANTQPKHEYLYWEFHEGGFVQAVRMGDWKAVKPAPGKALELYDLGSDVGEQVDVAEGNAGVVARMAEILRTARTPSEYWI